MMPERASPYDRRALVALGLVVLIGLAGCVGQDDSVDTASADATATDPTPTGNRTDEGRDDQTETDPPNASTEPGNRTATANRSASSPPVSVDLVWATDSAIVRWDHEAQTRTRIDLSNATGPDGAVSAIAWGPDGDLFATARPAFGPEGVSASPTGTPAVVRVDLGAREAEILHAGAPLRSPVGLTVLEDGRVLVGDRGEVSGTPDPTANAAGRVVEVSPDGQAGVLAADPRFDGWMDLHTVDGTVYLATQTDQRLLVPSTGNGTGALWTVDPGTGAHELAAASPVFQEPSGIAAGSDSLYVTEWSGQRLLQVDPSSGEASVVSPVESSQNLWGLDKLPDGQIVASGESGIWLVDLATGSAEQLVEAGAGSPRHVRMLVPS